MDLGLVISFLGGAVAGGIVQLIVTLLFEDFFRSWHKRLRRRLLQTRSLLKGNGGLAPHRDLFQIGKARTNCIVLDGAADQPYRPGHVICRLDAAEVELPADLEELRDRIHEEQRGIGARKGHPTYFNGPMVALTDWGHSRTESAEDPLLFLRFRLTDYYSFLATALSLDRQLPDESGPITVRDRHLRGHDFRSPVPYLATSFGVNLAVVTKDGFLVLARRGQGVSHYAGTFAVPVLESVNPQADGGAEGHVDLFKAARRGVREEVGLEVDDHEIRLFSLVVDTTWYLYGLTGAVVTERFTRDDIISQHSMGTKDKWESAGLHYVRFEPRAVAEAIHQVGGAPRFHPSSFVSVVQTLICEFGQKAVRDAFEREAAGSHG